MSSVLTPVFEDNPKRLSATYTLSGTEQYLSSFVYDFTNSVGISTDHDPSTKTVSAQFDWEPGHTYFVYINFAYPIGTPGVAPNSDIRPIPSEGNGQEAKPGRARKQHQE